MCMLKKSNGLVKLYKEITVEEKQIHPEVKERINRLMKVLFGSETHMKL